MANMVEYMDFMRFYAALLFTAFCLSITTPALARQTRSYVTRAEAIHLLLSSRKESIPDEKNNGTYPDLVDGQWYVKYILAAVDRGMIDADPKRGLIYPHRHVTRAEFLKFMTIAYQLPTDLSYSYEDIPPQAWYRKYVGLADRHNLFLEREKNKLLPNQPISHKEATQVVHTIFNSYDDMLTTAHAGLRPSFRLPIFGQEIKTDAEKERERMQKESKQSKNVEQVNPAGPVTTVSNVRKAMLKLFRKNKTVSPQETKIELIEAVNRERKRHGRQPLGSNAFLEDAAQAHARDMAKRGYFSHFTPEGASYVDRIRFSKYMTPRPDSCTCETTFQINRHIDLDKAATGPVALKANDAEQCVCKPIFAVGENIAKGQLTVEQVMEDWMNSPAHRKNILRSEFEEIGIGIYNDVWAQNFGRIKFRGQ